MSSQESGQNRPHLNIGTFGHLGHGKTTLTAALAAVAARTWGGDTPDEVEAGPSTAVTRSRYASPTRDYIHLDCPGDPALLAVAFAGEAQMDGAILAVSATEGLAPEVWPQILFARQAGITQLVVFLGLCDQADSEEILELIEQELRELLAMYGFPGDDVPIIRGSALRALDRDPDAEQQILELITFLDSYLTVPTRHSDQSFRLPVGSLAAHPDGTAFTGRIDQGALTAGSDLDIVGLSDRVITAPCTGLEVSGQAVEAAAAGDAVTLILAGVDSADVQTGQILADPGTLSASTVFMAETYLLQTGEGGRRDPLPTGYQARFLIGTAQVTGTLDLPEDQALPGDNLKMTVTLNQPLPLSEEQRLAFLDDTTPIGAGVIIQILQ
ncbi:GTP-binding protein [Streptomyces xanthochromogenes]|uniref:GTP-binding protein n=1 Tax=Streptomyces xanthochromogenes TaxID=67384 RepID=UPI003816A942